MGRYRSSQKSGALKKPPLTHFLCLPLVTKASRPQFEHSLRAFRDSMGANQQEGESSKTVEIHPRAIRPVGALHCTLGVMSLRDDRLSEAISFLESLDPFPILESLQRAHEQAAAEPKLDRGAQTGLLPDPLEEAVPSSPPRPFPGTSIAPLEVALKGLEPMHSPESTSILYSAPTDTTNRLYPFCENIREMFRQKGFLVEDNRKLKLHATIVNTIYARGRKEPRTKAQKAEVFGAKSVLSVGGDTDTSIAERPSHKLSGSHGPHANTNVQIDARRVIDQYSNFVWAGEFTLDRLAMCEMGAKRITNDAGQVLDEQYTEVATVSLLP